MARPECKVEREQLLHDCGYSVDLLLRQERIAVEVDGKVHYCRTGPWDEDDIATTSDVDAGHSGGSPTIPATAFDTSMKVRPLLPRRLGRTVLKHRQIKAKGWRIVSIPWWEWESLKKQSRGAHVRYLARKVCGVSDNCVATSTEEDPIHRS